MFFKYLRIIVFISLLDSCLAFSQVADVDSILYKSIINQNKINYTGVIKREIFHNDSCFTIKQRIFFRAPDRMWSEILIPAKMKGAVIVRIGKKIFFKSHRSKIFRLRESSRGREPANEFYIHKKWFNLLKNNYRFVPSEIVEIAGRWCYPVIVKSVHPERPWIKAWFDKDNSFLLKFEKYNSENKVIYRSSYEEINFNSTIDENIFKIKYKRDKKRRRGPFKIFSSYESLNEKTRKELIKVNYIPPGFILDRIIVTEWKGEKFYHIIYTDGLNTLSLFQREINKKNGRIRSSDRRKFRKRTEERRGSSYIVRGKKGKYFI